VLNELISAALALSLQAAPPPSADASQQPAVEQAASAAQGGQQGGTEGVRFVWREHPSFRAGRWLRLDFTGKFQWDARNPGDNPVNFDTAELHRARLGVEGEVFRHIQFNIERELTEREIQPPVPTLNTIGVIAPTLTKKSTKEWKDVWIEANYTSKAQVRAGKFKIPFGLEQLTGIVNLDFVYRSLSAVYLAPGRDRGAMVHGEVLDGALGYAAGGFKQDGVNARSRLVAGGDHTAAGRVTVRPLKPIKAANLDRLEIGSAFAVSDVSDESLFPNGLRARTVVSQFVYFEPVFVKGRRKRFETDLDYFFGPVSVRGEFTDVRDDRDRQGFGDQGLPTARARAWYLSGTYVLTGEDKRRPVEPKRWFGAVELAARVERLRFDSVGGSGEPLRNPRSETILPNSDTVLTVGVNWYANRWVKLQINGIRERLSDLERSPTLDDSPFWSTVFRAQLGI
jgi:phosphate-selective porin OprO/OprP